MKKNLKRLVVTFALCVFATIVNVSAEEAFYTVNKGATFDNPFNGGKQKVHFGGGSVWTISGNGKTVNAYCKDPATEGPASNAKYKRVSISDEAYLAGLKYIFENTCNNEALRIAMIKAYSVSTGKASSVQNTTSNGENVGATVAGFYSKLVAGTDDYPVTTGSFTKAQFKTLLSNAKKATDYQPGVPTINVSVKGITASGTLNSVGLTGKLTINATGATIAVGSETGTDSLTVDIKADVSETNIIIKSTTSCTSDSSTEIDYSITFDYKNEDGTSASASTCTCSEVEVYQPENCNGSNCELQQLVACPSDGNNVECDESNNNCAVEEKGKLQCVENDNCEPVLLFKAEGDAVCDASGETIIEIHEFEDYSDETIEECILNSADNKDYGDNNNNASAMLMKSFDPELCEIYCTEDYELILPGPNANGSADLSGDDHVYANAGTFFTIDTQNDGSGKTNMYDETHVRCFGTPNYGKLTSKINAIRSRIVEAYNNLQYQIMLASVVQTQGPSDVYLDDPCTPNYDSEGKPVGETCTRYQGYGLESKNNTKNYEMNSSGEIVPMVGKKAINSVSEHASHTKLELPESDVSGAKFVLNEKISLATGEDGTIANILNNWNACFDWNMDYMDKYISECSTEIDFDYFDIDIMGTPDAGFIRKTGEPDKSGGDSLKLSGGTEKKPYIGLCSESDCGNANDTQTVKDATYLSGERKYTTYYDFNNWFYNYSDGSDPEWAQIDKDGNPIEIEDATLIKGFPISLETTQGKYDYHYYYKGMGHYFPVSDSGECAGRLSDIITDASLADDYEIYCHYDVNSCGDCESICVGEGCDLQCDGQCISRCVGGGCILDYNAGFLFTYRTISLNSPFPNVALLKTNGSEPSKLLALSSIDQASTKNGRKYSSNWNTPKGQVIKAEIDGKKENIYNDDPEYSVVLTPSTINKIRDYNESQLANGGYANKTLSCTTANGFARCKSSFLDNKDIEGKSLNIFDSQTKLSVVNGRYAIDDYDAPAPFEGPAKK